MRSVTVLVALASLSAQARAQPPDANIAHAAALTCEPEVAEGRLKAVVDGRPDTGFAFEVGTAGDGWVAFDFGAPRTITGLRFLQHSEVYYTTDYVVEADADGDGEYELTLAEGAEAKIGEWNEHRWPPAQVRVVRLRSVKGVSEGRRAHPCLAEVEILGPLLPGDSARAAELGNPVSTVSAPRPLQTATPLVAGDSLPAVMCGDDDASRQAAQTLTRSLAQTIGRQPDLVEGLEAARPGQRTIIALGNCATNALIRHLFFNWYAFEDMLYPGPGGYTLRTVCDPYPWRGGVNVIVIGGSDQDGLTAGAERLVKLVGEGGVLPHLLEVMSADQPSAEQVRADTAGAPPPTFAEFLDAARQYFRTGEQAYARRAIQALDLMVETYQRDPARDIPWNEETSSGPIFAAWEAFEPCPLLDDAARLRYTRAFLSLLYSLPGRVSGYSRLGQDDSVTWNHTTFPLLGLYFGGRYFSHYHHISATEEHLARAHACFQAQARSWKPQEDADSYVTCTMDHVIRYCLAEGLGEFLSGGNMARYADYMIGICDSRGWAAGFGDSHYSANPGLLLGVLPTALLTTGDPAYRWVLEHVDPTWRNPYQDLQPVQPDRFVGVNVFPLDEQLYRYTQQHPYYNEPLTASEVPLARAFDKISFRESWEPGAQYLLLDGFGRGKHLHYDTGCINEYVADGERWLADHDYLVRNTTEHCMLSVLRDGRGDQLVPSMAELRCAADLREWGLTRTVVPAYTGLDWDRTIAWRRGRYFVVIDRVTAREEGEYDLELTWKTEDQQAQRLEQGRAFIADRSFAAARTSDMIVQDDPEASGGKAVVLSRGTSRLALRFELPPGEYGLAIRGQGIDPSHDSVWVRVDGGDPVAFGVPQGSYGGPIGGGPGPTQELSVQGGNVHVMLVTLRELPPVRLDRLAFYADGEEVLLIEAEAAEAPRPDDALVGEQKQFFIKAAGPVSCRISAHESQGISIPLCVLHQRQHRRMAAGDTAEFASVFYNLGAARSGQYDLGMIAGGQYLVTGDDSAWIGLDGFEHQGIRSRAQVTVVQAGRIAMAGGTRLALPGARWESEQPRDLELDLTSGRLSLRGPDGWEQAERLSITDRARSAVQDALALRPEPGLAQQQPAPTEPAPPRWTCSFPEPGQVSRLQAADLDGDGVPEVLVAQGRWCHCLDLTGGMLWSFAAGDQVRDVADLQARPEPGREVALACSDTFIYLLSAKGKLLDRHRPLGTPHNRTFGERPWQVYVVDGLDLDADGYDEVVASLGNYEFIAFGRDWQRLWSYRQIAHGAMDIKLADADGDGLPEVFVGDKYGFVHGVARDGRRVFIGYSSIGDVQFDLADLTGDGRPEVIYGSSTGDMLVRDLDREIVWRFDNYGYAVRRVCAADLTGDGKPEVLLASATGYLYVLDAAGELLWRDRLGFAVNDVTVADLDADGRPEVIAAEEDGLVRVYHGDGTVVRSVHVPDAARLVCVPEAEGGPQILVGTGAGEVLSCP